MNRDELNKQYIRSKSRADQHKALFREQYTERVEADMGYHVCLIERMIQRLDKSDPLENMIARAALIGLQDTEEAYIEGLENE